jgi:hypothetical protein
MLFRNEEYVGSWFSGKRPGIHAGFAGNDVLVHFAPFTGLVVGLSLVGEAS